MNLPKYAKFVVAVLSAVAAALLTVINDDAITVQEIITVVILAAGAAGVRQVRNERVDDGPQQLRSSNGL